MTFQRSTTVSTSGRADSENEYSSETDAYERDHTRGPKLLTLIQDLMTLEVELLHTDMSPLDRLLSLRKLSETCTYSDPRCYRYVGLLNEYLCSLG